MGDRGWDRQRRSGVGLPSSSQWQESTPAFAPLSGQDLSAALNLVEAIQRPNQTVHLTNRARSAHKTMSDPINFIPDHGSCWFTFFITAQHRK